MYVRNILEIKNESNFSKFNRSNIVILVFIFGKMLKFVNEFSRQNIHFYTFLYLCIYNLSISE